MLILSIIITSSNSIDKLQRTINNIHTNSSRVSGCTHRQHLDHTIHSNNIWHSSSSVRIRLFDRPPSRPLPHPLIPWLSAPSPAPFPENPWRPAQNGTFYVQKGCFMVLNNTIGASSICTSACTTLLSIRRPALKNPCRVSRGTLEAAQALQAKLQNKTGEGGTTR
jgi:hypothetical protein